MKKFKLQLGRACRQAGFTLLELLVVISIIGILIAMGTVAFSTAQKKTRDARRRSDVDSIAKALELYYAENTAYPDSATCDGLTDFLPSGIPTDPQTGDPLDCTADGISYCVASTLEYEDTGNCTDTACTFAATGDYYCKVNQQ